MSPQNYDSQIILTFSEVSNEKKSIGVLLMGTI